MPAWKDSFVDCCHRKSKGLLHMTGETAKSFCFLLDFLQLFRFGSELAFSLMLGELLTVELVHSFEYERVFLLKLVPLLKIQ